jgi:hypothetical protein
VTRKVVSFVFFVPLQGIHRCSESSNVSSQPSCHDTFDDKDDVSVFFKVPCEACRYGTSAGPHRTWVKSNFEASILVNSHLLPSSGYQFSVGRSCGCHQSLQVRAHKSRRRPMTRFLQPSSPNCHAHCRTISYKLTGQWLLGSRSMEPNSAQEFRDASLRWTTGDSHHFVMAVARSLALNMLFHARRWCDLTP